MSGSYRTCGCAVVAVLLCVCFSCRIEVPVMELANAKIAVEKARKADAENFAHDEYRKAAEYLLQAHTLVFKEKDYDELMKAISLSEEYAKKAYTLALSRSLAHWKTRAESWIVQSEQACVRNISGAAYGEAEKYLEQIKKTGNQYPEQHVQYYRKICTSLEPFINTIPVLKKEILNFIHLYAH